MITTSTCCFCVKLRVGCLILGWLQAVFGIFDMIANITKLTSGESSDPSTTAIPPGWVITDIATTFGQVMMAITLLYGVYTQRKQFVYMYVVVQTVLYLIRIVMVALVIVFFAPELVATVLIAMLLPLALAGYFLVVVYSYYKEMYSEIPY